MLYTLFIHHKYVESLRCENDGSVLKYQGLYVHESWLRLNMFVVQYTNFSIHDICLKKTCTNVMSHLSIIHAFKASYF